MLDCRLLLAGERTKPRLKKLRILFVLLGLGVLALVSMVFGMIVAVSRDLPAIYNFAQYKASQEQRGLRRLGRADRHPDQQPEQDPAQLGADLPQHQERRGLRSRTRASTSTTASTSRASAGRWSRTSSAAAPPRAPRRSPSSSSRTRSRPRTAARVFQKFREAALAYRLERRWSKDKILTEYLNTIYFGEGAYGIEAAARTFFGEAHPGCGTETEPCAAVLEPWEAATAGRGHRLSLRLRPQVLPRKRPLAGATWCWKRCTNRATSPTSSSRKGRKQALPPPDDIEPPSLDSEAPYFTSWLRQQLVDRFGAAKTFFGGLRVKTTLDLRAAGGRRGSRQLLSGRPPPDRRRGRDRQPQRRRQGDGRRARLRGDSRSTWRRSATASRAPRSSRSSSRPRSSRGSRRKPSTNRRRRSSPSARRARNCSRSTTTATATSGSASLATATTYSDNSVYAQVGLESIEGGTARDRPHGPRARRPDPALHQPGDGPRRARRRRDAAGVDLRLLHPRQRRRPGQRHPGPDPGNSPVAYTEVTDQDGDLIKGGDNDSTPHPGARRRRRRRSEGHPAHGGHQRHRRPGRHRRRNPVGQDGDDRRTTATPGSAAPPTKSPPASGSATPTR